MRISVDGSRIRNNKVAFSNFSGIVWTGPDCVFFSVESDDMESSKRCEKLVSPLIFIIRCVTKSNLIRIIIIIIIMIIIIIIIQHF